MPSLRQRSRLPKPRAKTKTNNGPNQNEPRSPPQGDLGSAQSSQMILSVSRRTDIPAFYAEWFFQRLKEGWLLTRNPFNPRQIKYLSLAPQDVSVLVFWTKDAGPMLSQLPQLAPRPFLFQYTLHDYGPELEPGFGPLPQRLDTFRRLADHIGPRRLLWRYSPVIVSAKYPWSWHLDSFGRLAEALRGYTDECRLAFVDFYSKLNKALGELGALKLTPQAQAELAGALAEEAARFSIKVSGCAQPHLTAAGVEAGGCLEARRLEEICSRPLKLKRDKNQRPDCLCVESLDVGRYNSCPGGCLYCYANRSPAEAARRAAALDIFSPLLADQLRPEDKFKGPPEPR